MYGGAQPEAGFCAAVIVAGFVTGKRPATQQAVAFLGLRLGDFVVFWISRLPPASNH